MAVSDQFSNDTNQNVTDTNKLECDTQSELKKKGKKMGRPRKSEAEKYKSTHIKLHPKIVEWAKAEAKKRGIGYQSVINETLLEMIIS